MLEARIEGFPGYGDGDSRRLSDELVRAYVGEALARVQERMGDSAAVDDLVERCAFAERAALHAIESPGFPAQAVPALARADAALTDLADRADGVDESQMLAFLGDVSEALDARDALMRGAVSDRSPA